LTKTQLINSASYFNLGRLGALFWETKLTEAPRGNGTGEE